MLVDKTTKQTYSSRSEAIRKLGDKEFKNKSRRNEFNYIQCSLV
jgi:metal-responsive CopG/Arc/MetJ family transcriptional regulator